MNLCRKISLSIVISLISMKSIAALNVAVSSNFKVSAEYIAEQFSQQYDVKVNISSASTSTLYQQILHGAPFDLFLSADQKHVQQLIDELQLAEHAFIYAQGRLVFWKPVISRVPTLQDFSNYEGRLAIANPKFAPYGIAAKETLETIKKWEMQEYVKGNNINQTYQFVDSHNVQAGLVSYAAVVQKKQTNYVLIPKEWHKPLIQSGIVLAADNRNAQLFKQYLQSKVIQHYIKSQGYI